MTASVGFLEENYCCMIREETESWEVQKIIVECFGSTESGDSSWKTKPLGIMQKCTQVVIVAGKIVCLFPLTVSEEENVVTFFSLLLFYASYDILELNKS